MPPPKVRTATYADIEALPEHMVGEILFGILHAHPRPAPRHLRASTTLGVELGGPFGRGRGGPGGWVSLDEKPRSLFEQLKLRRHRRPNFSCTMVSLKAVR